jgi:hypothetical protein
MGQKNENSTGFTDGAAQPRRFFVPRMYGVRGASVLVTNQCTAILEPLETTL